MNSGNPLFGYFLHNVIHVLKKSYISNANHIHNTSNLVLIQCSEYYIMFYHYDIHRFCSKIFKSEALSQSIFCKMFIIGVKIHFREII